MIVEESGAVRVSDRAYDGELLVSSRVEVAQQAGGDTGPPGCSEARRPLALMGKVDMDKVDAGYSPIAVAYLLDDVRYAWPRYESDRQGEGLRRDHQRLCNRCSPAAVWYPFW